MKKMIFDKICKLGQRRGRGGRTAASIATVALSACMVVRLDAAVIDDFEGPRKFEAGNLGTNYFLFGLTNGQMVVSKLSPVPTPFPGVLPTCDSVFWTDSLPGVSLEGGRTLELRMDLIHTSADDLFLAMGGFAGNGGYGVLIDQNEIALAKFGNLTNACFFWDNAPMTMSNVTVVLDFTAANSSLEIIVRILSKGSEVYRRSFVDGPGQDGPLPPPDPEGTGLFKQDPGPPYTNLSTAWAGFLQWIPTKPPPLEMLLDNLEYDVYYPPHLEIARATNAVDLSWMLPWEEHIVVEADHLDGPWCPCPQPYIRTGDLCCLTMPCQSQQEFFKLTPGRQFTDDFSGAWGPFTNRNPWMPLLQGAGEEWNVTNGVLQLDWHPPTPSGFAVLPLGTNAEATLGDFYVSVDVLDWVTSGSNWSVIALTGRGKLVTSTYGKGYMGGIGLNFTGAAGKVTLMINYGGPEVHGPSFDFHEVPPPYRIQFSGVGPRLLLRVLNLTTGQLIKEMSFYEATLALTEGFPALWVNGGSNGSDAFKITADNFFVTGTKP